MFEEPGFCGESYILEKGLYGSPEDWGALHPTVASAMPVILVRTLTTHLLDRWWRNCDVLTWASGHRMNCNFSSPWWIIVQFCETEGLAVFSLLQILPVCLTMCFRCMWPVTIVMLVAKSKLKVERRNLLGATGKPLYSRLSLWAQGNGLNMSKFICPGWERKMLVVRLEVKTS